MADRQRDGHRDGAARGSVTFCCPPGPGRCIRRSRRRSRPLVPARGHMTAGLAGDQLGYLIAPFEAYPEPVGARSSTSAATRSRRSTTTTTSSTCPTRWGTGSPCSLLRGAGETAGGGLEYWNRYDRCPLFTNDVLLSHGADARGSERRLAPPFFRGPGRRRRTGARPHRAPRTECGLPQRVGPGPRSGRGRSSSATPPTVRRWTRAPFRTAALIDRRGRGPHVEHPVA